MFMFQTMFMVQMVNFMHIGKLSVFYHNKVLNCLYFSTMKIITTRVKYVLLSTMLSKSYRCCHLTYVA